MQSEETALSNNAAAKIIRMDDYGSRRKNQIEKQRGRIRTADDKFASLDETSQTGILSFAIGYIEAAKDMISSGKRARTNEVSRLFDAIEESINEKSCPRKSGKP